MHDFRSCQLVQLADVDPQLRLEARFRWFLDLFDAENILGSSILPYLHWLARYVQKHFRFFPHGDFFTPLKRRLKLQLELINVASGPI